MRLLPLADVAERTGESVPTLRRWCATGRLSCEHADGAWVIGDADLSKVRALGVERRAHTADQGAVGVIVHADSAKGPALAADVEDALRLARGSVVLSRLALDDEEWILIVWPVDAGTREHAGELLRMAESVGGDLLDGELSLSR